MNRCLEVGLAAALVSGAVGCSNAGPDRRDDPAAVLQAATLPAGMPLSANPYMALLPHGAEADWEGWRAVMGAVSLSSGPMTLAAAQVQVAALEPNETQATAPLLALGTRAPDFSHLVVTGSIRVGNVPAAQQDVDFFAVDLEAGDVIGANLLGAAAEVALLDPSAVLRVRSVEDQLAMALPAQSPLPRGGGGRAFAYVVERAGRYAVRIRNLPSDAANQLVNYQLELAVFRPKLESAAPGEKQILFVDFDGATLDPNTVFRNPNNALPPNSVLDPLSSFLAAVGLTGQENTIIDAALARLSENLRADLRGGGNNARFDIEIQNSRDHADPFGQPNVSRVIIGGNLQQFFQGGLAAIAFPFMGLSSSIDPGNFETADTAVVALDLFTGVPLLFGVSDDSLVNLQRADGVGLATLAGAALGDIASHEVGHFVGNFHTTNETAEPTLNEGPLVTREANIMDEGGLLKDFLGTGPDATFGNADDIDVDFGFGSYSFVENFSTREDPAAEDTLNTAAFGLSSPCINANLSEHLVAGRVTFREDSFFGFPVVAFTTVGSGELVGLVQSSPTLEQLVLVLSQRPLLRPRSQGGGFEVCL
jgi:hypothetical protein